MLLFSYVFLSARDTSAAASAISVSGSAQTVTPLPTQSRESCHIIHTSPTALSCKQPDVKHLELSDYQELMYIKAKEKSSGLYQTLLYSVS